MSTFPSVQNLRIPGEDSWEVWCVDLAGSWTQSFQEPSFRGGLLAIPVGAMDSAPFWVPQAAEATLAGTTALRWEALGWETGAPGAGWTHWRAGRDGDRLLVGTLALAHGSEETDWSRWLPDHLQPSACLFPIPPGSVAIWKELGRLVIAFQRGDKLIHTSMLSSRELDAAAAWEVRDLAMALESQGLISQVAGVVVWTAAEPTFMETLQVAMGVTPRQEPKPSPEVLAEAVTLLPPGVAQARLRRQKQRQRLLWGASGAMLVVAYFSAWAGWLLWRESGLNRVEASLQVVQPEVEAIRNTQLRWYALEPAIVPEAYPVEVFHQLVALLPEEGIRFKEFSMDLEKVVITGEASSPGSASKFQADLKASAALSRYAFSSPVPSIGPDNRASFRVEGSLNGGGGDEGE